MIKLQRRYIMTNGIFNVPIPKNEPIFSYEPGSQEKKDLKAKIVELKAKEIEIPVILGGEEAKTGKTVECRCPHETKHLLGIYHKASEKEVEQAIQAALAIRPAWASMSWEARASIFLKAAELLAGPYRAILNEDQPARCRPPR